MSSIIVAANALHGHTTSMLTITEDLVRRGHDVRFLGAGRYADAAKATGARFYPLPRAAAFDDRQLDEEFPERFERPPGRAQLQYDLQHLFVDRMPGQHVALQALLEDEEASVVVSDSHFLGTWPVLLGAAGIRPRVVTIGVGVPMLRSVDHAPFGAGLPPDRSPSGREHNVIANTRVRDAFAAVQEHLLETLRRTGAPTDEVPFIFDATVALPDEYLALTIPEFDYPRSDTPEAMRMVGPLPPPSSQDAPLPAWWDELTPDRPVVLVHQGTVHNTDLRALIVPTLDALAAMELHIVVATGQDPAPEVTLPENAVAGGYLPFDRLLARTDVVVTNGGYRGVQQALAAGVPLVVGGDGDDRPEIAARVAWAGVGVNLRHGRPEPHAIRMAVTQVLAHARYRTRAARLRRQYAKHDALHEIAASVERAVVRSA
jgi:MGT family glycosyltransferase